MKAKGNTIKIDAEKKIGDDSSKKV